MSFGARLAEQRRLKKLTQEGLGKGLGTDGKDASKAVVYGWEKDQHFPRVDQLVLICNKLGCSADFLLLGKAEAENLSPDVLQVAQEIDSIPHPERSRVLRLCREVVGMARESVSRAKTVTQTEQHPKEVHRPLVKSA